MENIINNIDDKIVEYKTLFQKNKKLKITSFLKEQFADALFKNILLEKNWNLASGIDNKKYEKLASTQNDKINNLQIKNVNNSFGKDHFSYIFYRAMNANKMSFFEFTLRNMLNSKEFIDKINEITNLNVSRTTTVFLSKYKNGNFLSPHSDKGNGKIAFVIYLSKFWKPQYGGVLHFMNEERTEIIESFVPSFNTLVLFEVPPENGISHYISHIAPNVQYSRYAITGWYE